MAVRLPDIGGASWDKSHYGSAWSSVAKSLGAEYPYHLYAAGSLKRLGFNLAMAGALCLSFDLGAEWHDHFDLYEQHGYRVGGAWSPGCGRLP